MKILMFGWEFPPHISGGLGTACYGIVKGLERHQTDIIFVVPKAHGNEFGFRGKIIGGQGRTVTYKSNASFYGLKHTVYQEVYSKMVPYMNEQEFWETHNNIVLDKTGVGVSTHQETVHFTGTYGVNLMDEVNAYAEVSTQIAQEHSFDIIHAHDWLTYMAGVLVKYKTNKPLIIHVHATEFDRSGKNINIRVYEIERLGMIHADAIIAVSQLTKDTIVEKYYIAPEKIFVIHNGVDFKCNIDNRFKKGTDEKIITFLGRITFQKGPEYFVEAAKLLLDRVNNVRFIMAGGGDMLPRIVKQVSRAKIGDRFNFVGFLRGEEVQTMFSASDIYVMPSVSEPFGISPLEAMSLNVPVIISKQSGVAEVLKYALKIDFWDVEGLANAMYALIQYKALNEILQVKGKEEVDTVTWASASDKIFKIYKNIK
ncbi:MAG: glycosyltransferase family 4 protein [Chitinophagaceae bacterium]